MKIDLEDIQQRILALPLPARNYLDLQTGREGVLYVVSGPLADVTVRGFAAKLALTKFDLAARKSEPIAENISAVEIAADGDKMLYKQGSKWFLTACDKAVKPGDGQLNFDEMEALIDPPAEWREMFREVWRIERDFLYDPGYHGVNLRQSEKHYRPYLAQVASRRDLNYLFEEMLSDLSLGHVFVAGGEVSEIKGAKVGLLGADFTIDKGRFRFGRIYQGENWSPDLRAPLSGPGINVKAGEYLLAVNGASVAPPDNVYRFFEGTAGKRVILRVGPDPGGKFARRAGDAG